MVYNFFDKMSSGGDIKNENTTGQQLPEELHKPMIRKFKQYLDIGMLILPICN